MKKHIFFLLVFLIFGHHEYLNSQSIEEQSISDWKEIDARPVPQWWQDAKFGIFIHWGIYSVPAFSRVGEYSEWYWQDLSNKNRKGHALTTAFHQKNYGLGFTYPDFATEFTCELFKPDQWAKLFEESGAKYIVLTSKHHDGYCLWNSQEANQSWGRPWNSLETGPQRDLLGELTNAVRKTEVKMGIYYSLYEWFNPLYKANPELFVEKHLMPQFKDVVMKYQPSVIFSDGEWDHPYTTWRSTELLNWLYEKSPNKETVVVNDRWGAKTRHHHGGYYTTEYGSGLSSNHPWEECRGMAHSFGYNRAENIHDYNTSQELIYMLIDIVSRGGNFLLDIGPTGDGRIPVIMQQRLIDIGKWLKVNGEAIYGTKSWEKSCQWSAGKIRDAERGAYMTEYDIMKLTLNPDEGMATKEIFFTQKEDVLFCITSRFPDENLIVKDLQLSTNTTVNMLGFAENLKWKQKGKDVWIMVPNLNPSDLPSQYAHVFRIKGVD